VIGLTFIYALKDPDTGEIRYVGKANNPEARLRNHIGKAKEEKNHRANWIKSLMARGKFPVLEIIDESPEDEWPMLEAAYIQFYTEEGCNLVNGTFGGEGLGKPTPETRHKMSIAQSGRKGPNLGRKFTPEWKEKISIANTGKKMPMRTKEILRRIHTGSKHSPEHCAKLSVANKGKKRSPETRIRISRAKLGIELSQTHRDNLSLAIRGKKVFNRKHANSSSKYYGVYWHKPQKNWCSVIRIDGHRFFLGRHSSELDAAITYDWVAALYAMKLNFP